MWKFDRTIILLVAYCSFPGFGSRRLPVVGEPGDQICELERNVIAGFCDSSGLKNVIAYRCGFQTVKTSRCMGHELGTGGPHMHRTSCHDSAQ